jgi:hypothetical protein
VDVELADLLGERQALVGGPDQGNTQRKCFALKRRLMTNVCHKYLISVDHRDGMNVKPLTFAIGLSAIIYRLVGHFRPGYRAI